jgi:hypothetical protein
MDIRTYTIARMRAALETGELWRSAVHPISRQRAVSQVHNPRARDDDVILIAAYEQDEPVAYVGMLPDLLHGTGGVCRMAWGTTWWMDPRRATQGLGGLLLLKAISHHCGLVAIDSFTPETEDLYKATNRFVELARLHGRRYVFRPDLAEWVSERRARQTKPAARGPAQTFHPAAAAWNAGRMRPFVKSVFHGVCAGIDAGAGVAVDARLRWHRRHWQGALRSVVVTELAELDSSSESFLARTQTRDLSRRGKAEFSWILSYPWILERPRGARTAEPYYFSAWARQYSVVWLKIADVAGSAVGLALLVSRDGWLKLPYLYYAAGREESVAAVIAEQVLVRRAAGLEVYDSGLNRVYEQWRFPAWSKRAICQTSLMTKQLANLIPQPVVVHPGDGDGVFT